MSMYSELLSELCTDMDPVRLPASRDELVVILLQYRRKLPGPGVDPGGGQDIAGGHDLTEDLALELDHDCMLIRLCAAVGIESDATQFVSPLVERARLEALLRQRGIDFRTLDDNRREAKVVDVAASVEGRLSAG